MEIVFVDSHTLSLDDDIDFSPILKLGNYVGYKLKNNDDVAGKCKNAEVMITNKVLISGEIINSLDKLKLICVIATGYNNIDLEAASLKNIPVLYVPEYARYSVSQHAFSLILNLATKSFKYFKDVKSGMWEKSEDFGLLKYKTFELAGKVIGIIGFGAIGREVAEIARGFKMKIMVHDIKNVSDTGFKNYSLEEVLKKSDVVTIHCPLNDETKNLINKDTLSIMKRSTILINTSRGGIVNENDLKEALDSGSIAGAGIDVLSEEPPKNGNPLLGDVRNIIITPHTAWSTAEARQRMIDITADNIRSFIDGNLKNRVNF